MYFGVPIVFLAWTDTTYSLSDIEAKEYLTRLTPNVAKSHDDLGVAYSRKGLFDKGIASHQKAIAADSSFAQAYTHMGIAHSLKGNRQKAVELHLKAIKIDPEVAQAHFNLGVDYLHMRRVDQAAESFQRAIQIDPEYGRAYSCLLYTSPSPRD